METTNLQEQVVETMAKLDEHAKLKDVVAKEVTMTIAFFAYIRTIQQSMRPEFKRISTPEVWYCLDRFTDLD